MPQAECHAPCAGFLVQPGDAACTDNVSERLVLGCANAGLLLIHVACLPLLTEVSQTDEGHTGWQAWKEADGKLMLVQALASHRSAQEMLMTVAPENMCLLLLPLAGAGRKKRCLQVCS